MRQHKYHVRLENNLRFHRDAFSRPRSGQSTVESLLLLAAAAVLLLGLLVFAGNGPAGGATLLGRTRELVCQVLAGGNGVSQGNREVVEDDRPILFDEPTRSRPQRAPANRLPSAMNREGDSWRFPPEDNRIIATPTVPILDEALDATPSNRLEPTSTPTILANESAAPYAERAPTAIPPLLAFPHQNPCLDPVFARLASENYDPRVIAKLDQIKDKYILQPVGSRAPTTAVYATYDRYAIRIPKDNVPLGFDPSHYLSTWTINMADVPKQSRLNYIIFNMANLFHNSTSPTNLGDVIPIDILGFYRANVMLTQSDPTFFRLSTLETRSEIMRHGYLRHPVSGSREFGFSQNADGSLTFYTQAIDSPTDLAGSYVGPYIQAIGWSHFMAGIGRRFGMEYRDVKKSIRMESFMNKDLEKKPVCVLPNERPPLLIKYGKSL